MKPVAALAVGVMALWAQTGKPAAHTVTAVRHWSLGGVTRMAVEISGEFEFRTDRLHDPERVYYDILSSRPKFDNKRLYTEDLEDPFVKRIRVAETQPGVTRVVLDLNGMVEATASVLSNPDRLIIELRSSAPATIPTTGPTTTPTAVPAAVPTTTPLAVAVSPATTLATVPATLATSAPATIVPATIV